VTGFARRPRIKCNEWSHACSGLDEVSQAGRCCRPRLLSPSATSARPLARLARPAPAGRATQAPTRDRVVARLVTSSPMGETAIDLVGTSAVWLPPARRPEDSGFSAARQEATFAVHTHVRESPSRCTGFASGRGADGLRAALGAHRRRPGLALAILSIHDPAELAQVIASGKPRGFEARPRRRAEDRGAPASRLQARFDYLSADGVLGTGSYPAQRPPSWPPGGRRGNLPSLATRRRGEKVIARCRSGNSRGALAGVRTWAAGGDLP